MISVIIPVFNAEDTIVDCINSVISQTRCDLIDEILVIDDGSTDRTVQEIEHSINSDLVRVVSKANGGVSSARNEGIRLSQGSWIALLDSDDIWLSNKIEKQYEKIVYYPEIKFIGTNRNNENVKLGNKIDDDLYQLKLRHILMKNWPHTSTVLIDRSVFDEIGMFDETMKYAEDGDLWNRIIVHYPLYYISESLEIAGGYKLAYGEKGLSANLEGMHAGNIHNLRKLREQSELRTIEYTFWRVYFEVKYVKRIIVTKLYKNRRRKK